MSRSLKRYLGKILFMAIVIPFAMSPSLFILFSLTSSSCDTTPVDEISNVPGYDVDVVRRTCDYGFGAGEDSINVFASKTGNRWETLFARKALLFKYDLRWSASKLSWDEMPDIRLIGPKKIRISVPALSEVYSWRSQLDDLYIVYDIGEILYPYPSDPPTNPKRQLN